MKHLLMSILVAIILCASASAQVQKGDKEIQVSAYIVSVEEVTVFTAMGTFGMMVTPNLELGVGPMITHVSFYFFDDTQFSMAFFGRYNFSVQNKTVPYVSAQWYQFDFSPDAPFSFFDYSYVQVGGGFKYFINPHIAYDVSGNLGFALGASTTVTMLSGGLSYFF